MQFKCLGQELIDLRIQQKKGHKNIMTLASAVNNRKRILKGLYMGQRLMADE